MKHNSILKFLLLIIVLATTACSHNDLSKREESLLIQNYQTLLIPIDKLNTLNDLLDYYDSTYCQQKQDKWPFVYLDMKLKKLVSKENRNTIRIGIEPSPCDDVVFQFDRKMILEIIKDGHNTEIERVITEVDSIPSFMKKQFLSFGEDPNYAIGGLGNGVWICTKKADKLENLNPYIYNVVIGFIQSVRKYSQMAYSKNIDKLNEEEFEEIKKEFMFHLSFKFTDEKPKVSLDSF